MALWAYFTYRLKEEAVCFVGVKKPSQIFVPLGQAGAASSASVPLLEGQTYKEVVQGIAFSGKVASRLKQEGLRLDAGDVSARLQVDFKDPDLIKLRGLAKDPSVALRVANAACRTLVDLNQKDLRIELQEQVKSVSALLQDAAQKLEETNADLRAYMKRQGLLNVDFNSGSSDLFRVLEVLSQQEQAKATAEANLRAAGEQLKELQVQEGARVSMYEFPVDDPTVTNLRIQIEAFRLKLWDAQKQFTDAHPIVKDLRAQLEVLQKELDDRIRQGRVQQAFRPSLEHELAIRQKTIETRQEISKYRAEIAARSRVIAQQRRSLGVVPDQRAELERLKLAVAAAQDRYQALGRKLDDTRVSLDSVQGTLSITQLATAIELPNTRRRILITVVLLISLPLGMGLLLDYLDPTNRNPLAFGRQVGLRCLAVVPKARRIGSPRLRVNGASRRESEALHILRSAIRVAAGDLRSRRIAVVGPRRGVGRSTVLVHLARELAEDQTRVVMVDADLRSASLGRMLRVKSQGGLLEVLMGERTLPEVLHRAPFHAQLLPAVAEDRRLPPNADLLFRQPQFERTLYELSAQGDFILFDTAPLLEYADTLELLQHMDGVILVAEARSNVEDVQRCVELLEHFEVKRLGVVLNKVPKGV
jgi:Mrp family chromosome partitioning ATPase/uncharacterized protein involved in exopolysaccharide biosynthesis